MTDQTTVAEDILVEHDFNPTRYLTDIKGKAYLPVAARIAWFRHLHPDGIIETTPHQITPEIAIFHARVATVEGASATGYGSCEPHQFPDGWIEKAETKALGRALAALGYGTLATDDFDDDGALADSPIGGGRGMSGDGPHGPDAAPARSTRSWGQSQGRPRTNGSGPGYPLATDKQKGMIERRTREAGLTAADVEAYVREHYGAALADLGKRDASDLIDALGAGEVPKAAVSGGSPEHAEAAVDAAYRRQRQQEAGPAPARNGSALVDPHTRFWSAMRDKNLNQGQAGSLANARYGQQPAQLTEDQLTELAAEVEQMTREEVQQILAGAA